MYFRYLSFRRCGLIKNLTLLNTCRLADGFDMDSYYDDCMEDACASKSNMIVHINASKLIIEYHRIPLLSYVTMFFNLQLVLRVVLIKCCAIPWLLYKPPATPSVIPSLTSTDSIPIVVSIMYSTH